MKTPIPRGNALDARVGQLERVMAALVELANPEQFRKALAAVTARTAIADLSQAVAAGMLTTAKLVSDATIAVRFREIRGEDEVITPAVVIQLDGQDVATRAMFEGKAVGEQVSELGDVRGILDQVWNRMPPARTHRPMRGGRHARR